MRLNVAELALFAVLLPAAFPAALLPKVVTAQYQHPFGPWRRRYMVVLVSIITALLCADQNLLAPNVSSGMDRQRQ